MNQGCQIFFHLKYQNGGKYTKLPLNYEMTIKIFQMATEYTNFFHSIHFILATLAWTRANRFTWMPAQMRHVALVPHEALVAVGTPEKNCCLLLGDHSEVSF
jgi:hypothetical protein